MKKKVRQKTRNIRIKEASYTNLKIASERTGIPIITIVAKMSERIKLEELPTIEF